MTNNYQGKNSHPRKSFTKRIAVPILLVLISGGAANYLFGGLTLANGTEAQSQTLSEGIRILNNRPVLYPFGYALWINGREQRIEEDFSREQAIQDCSRMIENYDNGQQIVDCHFDGQRIGYELLFNSERAGYQPAWSRERATQNCTWNIAQYDERGEPGQQIVDCQFDDLRIGYELRFNGRRAGYQPAWSRERATQNCTWNIAQYDERGEAGQQIVDCQFDDSLIGYELLFNGERAGYQPAWSRDQAIQNCTSNIARYDERGKEGQQIVDCQLDGTRIGYELRFNGDRVGYQPGWNRDQAIRNCTSNIARYDEQGEEGQKIVDCQLDGARLGYELHFDGERVGYQPAWSRDQAFDNCLWNVQQYGADTVSCYFDGTQIAREEL
jgi:hypothetical protein